MSDKIEYEDDLVVCRDSDGNLVYKGIADFLCEAISDDDFYDFFKFSRSDGMYHGLNGSAYQGWTVKKINVD